ncbi:tRNA(adenine34) deaminase [Peptoclostridium litorale DSM 5388]|uniref:tRNA-specific adenosine deaminase n=1 Tax=Peptoclostridium litorale DSM 5388 TaxID=1121324 RepID=A0A069RBS0_PEPLI|nr:tRNA adenosine(34) deaminase TadA [Peptoclostridium litorale]KDR94519.1 tRNA-specific adenosine deaminase TadA [Peptoclostridium litorale DSM 5388]SIO35245.1 tRNA(adenine34) deaminase [Peptoclostridium litorale DSM 5388]
MEDILYMREALKQAKKAYLMGEVPIGAVIVRDGKIISKAHNMRESLSDPTAHAEMIAIKKASETLKGWRLNECTMYVTIEPCCMCAGAIVQSRIKRLVIGSKDEKAGACGSKVDVLERDLFNHNVDVSFGILSEECSSMLTEFFRFIRENKCINNKKCAMER